MRMRVALLLAVAAAPAPLRAEGARLEMTCDIVSRCQALGPCAAATGALRFAVEPEALDRHGSGDYSIWVDDSPGRPARGLARTGPFNWTDAEGAHQSLALTGPQSALRIRQGDGGAEMDLMRCEVLY
ncbi:hypothetical protein [Pseudooceanicola sp.]|uniref:hypothetical protein n=1 Tax=Pseudooceanicola sp. TaxID=1914328 RepID=UPI00260D3E49|nr:hypothetical protein [Pseudooceanicola sp.]MDF1856604.1 hypothetical protein [Pseudooceanicola sp.]